MKLHPLVPYVSFLLAVQAIKLPAQEESSASTSQGVEKALKYYDALTKRPAAGYLFDRFYNSWVDAQTIEELEKFLKDKASAPDATTNHRLVLAFFYAKQNEHPKALEQFRLALEKDPGNADAWFQKANAEVRTLDFESALKDLTKALESKPSVEMTRLIRQMQGRLLARLGKNDEAMKAWQELLAAHPSDEDLQEDLIELQINEGLNKEALITAQSLLDKTKDPYKKVQRRLRIGDIHSRLGNRDQSIAAYTEALDQVGSDSWLEKEILDQIELTFRRDDAIDELKKHFVQLVEKYPQRITLRRAQAKLLAELGDVDAAVTTFQAILNLTPGDRDVREAYVSLLADARKFDEAVTQLQQLISQHPQDGELLIKLADLHSQAEKPEEAQKTLEDFLAKSDQSEQTYLRVAALLERYKRSDASLALYQKAVGKFPESEAAKENHAIALHKLGKKEEALSAWKKMAEGSDKVRVMNVARQAAARDEHALAYELLAARLADFNADSLFLTQICDEAQRVDKVAEAVPLAIKLVTLSKDAIDLDGALNLAAKLIERADKVDETIRSLQTSAKTAQEKCLLAELLERNGDSKGAESLLRLVSTEQADLGTALLVRLQTTRGDFVSAAETLKHLVETPSGRKPVHVQRLAELYEKAGLLDKALEWIPEWKKLTPGSTQAWLKEADLKASLGKMKEALLSLRQAAQQFEGNEDIRAQLGAAYRTEGKLADAERVFTQLYEEAKDNAAKIRWAGELAQTASQSGKLAELIEAFEERRRSNRTSVLPLLALAEIYRVVDNYEGRRQSLLEAARIKRDDIDLLLEIARIAEGQGEYDQALQTLKEAQALDKTDKVKQRIAKVLFAAGKEEEAKKLIFELSGGPKMDARAAEGMADSFLSQDAWKDAAEFLAPFVAKFPKDYRLAYQYAVALEESEQRDAALAEFQRIMGLKEELPTPTAASGSALPAVIGLRNRQNDWTEMMRNVMPQGALSFIELTQFSYQAMGYKNRNNGGYSRSSGGIGIGPRLQLPADVEDAPRYALAHIAQLAQELDEAKRQLLERDMKQMGNVPVELLTLLQDGRFNYNSPDFTELLEKHPDDENINALATLYSGYNQNTTEEQRLRMYRMFKDKRPILAAVSVMNQGKAESEELKAAFAACVDLIEKEEKPNYMLVDSIGRILNINQPDKTAEEEDATYKSQLTRLRAKLLAWYRAADKNPASSSQLSISYAGQLFSTVLNDLLRQEDPGELLTLLETEVTNYTEQSGKSRNSNPLSSYSSYSYGNQRLPGAITPATFPPQTLPDFPPLILTLLGDQNNNYYTRNWQPDVDKLKAALPNLKHPIFKLLLANKVEDETTVSTILQEMVSSKEPNFTTFVLAASWAAKKEKWDEAVATMHRAEYLPLTKEQRRTLDASILAWALLKLDADGKAMEATAPTLASAKDSALRLRRDVLTPDQKQELAEAMERIGLEAEAKRLTSATTGTASASSGGGLGMLTSSQGSRGTFNPGRTNKIDQLLQQGKPEAVVKLWQKQLRDLTKSWTTTFDDSLQYQAREWVQTMRQKMSSAEAELIKGMIPPAESKDPALVSQIAATYEILGKKKEAKEWYLKALELKPKDQNLRLIYVLFLMKEEPIEAGKMLSSLDATVISRAGNSLSNLIDNLENNEQRCSLAQLISSYLINLKPADFPKTDLSWLSYFVEQFARYGYDRSGNDSLPSLYLRAATKSNTTAKQSASEKKQMEANEKTQEQRRVIHDLICQTALTIPQTARFAFSKLAGMALANGKSAEDLADLARKALKSEFGGKSPSSQNGYGYSYDDDQIEFPTPEDVLLEAALKTNNPKLITDEIIPLLKNLKATQAAKNLEADSNVYFAPADTFVTAAENYVKRRSTANNPAEDGKLWGNVVRVMQLRKIAASIDAPILTALKKSSMNSYGGTELQHVTRYTKLLLDNNQKPAAKEFLEKVAQVFLGPVDKRQEFLKKNFTSNYGGNSPAAGIHKWLNLFRNLTDSAEYGFLMLDCYEENFRVFAKETLNRQQYVYLNVSQMFERSPGNSFTERALTVLKQSPFLNAGSTFRLFASDQRDECIFNQFVSQLRNAGTADRKALGEALAKEAVTFGNQLIQALLKPDGKMWQDSLEVIGNHLEELKSTPTARQAEWAVFLKYTRNQGGNLQVKDLTEKAKLASDWIDSLKDDRGKGRVESFLAAKSLQAVNMNEYSVRELVEQVLPGLLAKDAEQSSALLKKVRELVALERRSGRNGNSYSFGDGSSAAGYALSSVMRGFTNNSSNPPADQTIINALNVFAEAICSKQGFQIEYGTNARDGVLGLLNAVATETKANKKTFNHEKFITLLGEKLNPDFGRLYFSEIGTVLRNDPAALHKEANKVACDWIALQAISQQPHAWLAAIALQNIHLAQAQDADSNVLKTATEAEAAKAKEQKREPVTIIHQSHHGIVDPAKLPPEQKALLDISQNENWSSTARFSVLSNSTNLIKELTEPALRIAAARLLTDVWKAQTHVSTDDAGRAIRRLTSWAAQSGTTLPEEFKTLGTELLTAWKRALQGKNGSSSGVAPTILELACTLEDSATVNQIMTTSTERADRHWLAKLLTAKQFDAAKRLLMGSRENLFEASSDNVPDVVNKDAWQFNETLMALLPEFVKTLEGAPMQLTAEVLLNSLPVTDGAKKAGISDRKTRLTDLAKRFTPETLNNPELGERLLQLILMEDQARDALDPALLQKVAESISLASLPELDNSSIENRKKKLSLAYIHGRVEQNDLAPMEKALREITEATSTNQSYDLRSLGNSISDDFMSFTNNRWEKFDAKAREENRRFWREMIFNPKASKNFDGNSSQGGSTDGVRLIHVLLLHALDDAVPEFNEAFSKLDKDWQEHLAEKIKNADLGNAFTKMDKLPWPKDSEALLKRRSELFLKMLQASLPEIGRGSLRYFQDLEKKRLLTKSDFLSHAEELLKVKPRGGLLLLEWAEYLIADKKNEEALKLLARSEKTTIGEKTEGNAAAVILIRAQIYEKLEAIDLAVKSLQAIPEDLRKEPGEAKTVIDQCDKLLATLKQKLAIQQGDTVTVLKPIAEKLTSEKNSVNTLMELATTLELIGRAYSDKKEFATASQYFASSLLAFQAIRDRDDKQTQDNVNRLNNAYHQAHRDMNDVGAPRSVLARRSAQWRYLESGTAAPTDWQLPATDVTQWKEGKSPIGYGEDDLGTAIEPGGAVKNRPITCYFRTTFEVPEGIELKSGVLFLRRDDGAAVYLNGKEVIRDNVPDGPLAGTTLAKTRIDKDERVYHRHDIPVAELKRGTNTLAVEVHQSEASSSDIALDVDIVLNPSFVLDTIKALDLPAMIKTLGASWDCLPEETKALLAEPRK